MTQRRLRFLIKRNFQVRWALRLALAGVIIAAAFTGVLGLELEQHNHTLNEALQADAELFEQSETATLLLLNMPETRDSERAALKDNLARASQAFERSHAFKEDVLAQNRTTLWMLVAFVVGLGVTLLVWGVLVTHRIAGSMYVIEERLRVFEEDGTVDTRPLRSHDEFSEVHERLVRVLGLAAGGKGPGSTPS